MAINDVTTEAVQRALEQFEQLGREAFLARYGYGKARGYFIVTSSGLLADSKAIAGAAHGFLPDSTPLTPKDFSGGDRTVAAVLRRLGFTVRDPQSSVLATIPYEAGVTYHRRDQIHQLFGGQQQGGISTPTNVPYVFLFTGEAGEQYGYQDGPQPSGVFNYTGEGQVGDMRFIKGNLAIRDHLKNGKDLLLFQALPLKGRYSFLGCFACAGWHYHWTPDRNGQLRQSIVFELVPIEGAEPPSHEAPLEAPLGRSLEDLRKSAYEASETPAASPKDARRIFYERSARVKAYVLARASGKCEACLEPAPFLRSNGTPYLEPHHTRRVADGGPDHPRWVGAVCPTCHRRIHHGEDGSKLNEKLEALLGSLEP